MFNNLFLKFDYDEETNSILVKRRTREKSEKKIYLAVNLFAPEMETIGQLEFEIDKEKFTGRGNIQVPEMIRNSTPLSQKISLVTEGIVALKRTVKIKPQEKIELDLIIAVGESKEIPLENIKNIKIKKMWKKHLKYQKHR